MSPVTRKNFLKLNFLGLLGLGLPLNRPPGRFFRWKPGPFGRVATDEKVIPIYREPSFESDIVRETEFDELLSIYYQKWIVDAEGENNLWHRVWGGYLPGKYVQITEYKLCDPVDKIPDCGALAEVCLPYTDSLTQDSSGQWRKKYRLYYQTTHWITDVAPGPNGKPWYKLTSELSETLTYFVPQEHLRVIPIEEYLPTRIQVPPEEKHIEISIRDQVLTAFEYDRPVFKTTISSGIGYTEVPRGTGTPTGVFRVTSKYPSKQMGSSIPTGAPGGYFLPGVPWSTFFIYETGVAFHGTYWHNNFGNWMSHGCVNMRNEDAKWLFRWVNPLYDPPYKNHCDWYQTGRGTKIIIR